MNICNLTVEAKDGSILYLVAEKNIDITYHDHTNVKSIYVKCDKINVLQDDRV